MKSWWKRVGIVGLLLLVGLVAGCGMMDSNKPVTIGLLRLTSSAPIYIALEKGYFKDEGLEVKPEWFEAAQPIAVATASNKIDVGATGITAGLYNMAAQGQKVYIVADKGREEKGFSSTAVLVNKAQYDKGVKTLQDLKGKKVGITQIGSTFHYMMGRLLEKNHMTMTDVELVPLGKISAMMAALQAGQVDAILLNEPNITKAVSDGYGVVIQPVGDVIDYQTSGLFYSPSFMKDTDKATRFMRAYIRACRYYSEAVLQPTKGANYDEVIRIISQYTNMPKEQVEQGIPYIDANGALMTEDIDTQIAWYKKNDFIERGLEAKEVIDQSIWKKAMDSLK